MRGGNADPVATGTGPGPIPLPRATGTNPSLGAVAAGVRGGRQREAQPRTRRARPRGTFRVHRHDTRERPPVQVPARRCLVSRIESRSRTVGRRSAAGTWRLGDHGWEGQGSENGLPAALGIPSELPQTPSLVPLADRLALARSGTAG